MLATLATVTTTLPVMAPLGTGTTMLVVLQLVGVAVVPLNLTVLLPWGEPKFAPVIVMEVPTAADVGERLVISGAAPEPALICTLSKVTVVEVTRLPLAAVRPIKTFCAMLMVWLEPICTQLMPSVEL